MPAKVDHSGMIFGNWTLLKTVQMRPRKYLCRCSCGNESEVFLSNLKRGYSKNCVICQSLNKNNHLIGKKFHHLTILEFKKNDKNKKTVTCLCDCGNKINLYFGKINKKEEQNIASKYSSCGKCLLNNNRVKNPRDKVFVLDHKIGMLTIKKIIDKRTAIARCECGNERIVKDHHLLQVKIPSCGCYWKLKNIENSMKIEGIKYFYLTIKKFMRMGENHRAVYLVQCKCGKKFERSISHLFEAKSCGCLKKDLYAKGIIKYHSKLKPFEVISIRQLYTTNLYTKKDLAPMFNVCYEHICQIIAGKVWKNLL